MSFPTFSGSDFLRQPQTSGDSDPSTAVKQRFHDLEKRLDHLVLANMAMWSLLSQRAGVTEAELRAEMERIDLLDGVQDGRVTPTPTLCSACGRTISARSSRCLYCGAVRELNPMIG